MVPTDPARRPSPGRLRATIVFVLILVGAWLRPWTEAATGTGVRLESGPWRTGAVAAALLLVLAGLAITALVAHAGAGLRRGGALTDALLAGLVFALLASGHGWLPGGALRAVTAPTFVPLALLALLDAMQPMRAIARVRAVAGAGVALLFVLAGIWLPAGVALWLAVSPWLLGETQSEDAARRSLAFLQLLAATAAFFAPHLNAALLGFEDTGLVFDGRYLWQVGALVLMVLALVGMRRPSDADALSAS